MAGIEREENDNCLDKLDDQRSFAYLIDNKNVTNHGEEQEDTTSNVTKQKICYASISNEVVGEKDDYLHTCDDFEVSYEKPLFRDHEGVKQNDLNMCKEYNVNEDFESVNSFFEHEFKSDSQTDLQSSSTAPIYISSNILSKPKEKAEVVSLEVKNSMLSKINDSENENKRKNQKEIANVIKCKKIKIKPLSEAQNLKTNSVLPNKSMKKSQHSFPCSLCFSNFIHPYDCLVHMITKVCIRVSSHLYRTGKGLTCKTCGKTNFKSSKQAEQHANGHEKDKFKACPVCPQQFSPASIPQMIKHVQESHKKYLNTLNIRKWVRHHNITNNIENCEITDTTVQENKQVAGIAEPKVVPKLLQSLLCSDQQSYDTDKVEIIQNQEQVSFLESKAVLVNERPTKLDNSDFNSLPVTHGKFRPIFPKTSLNTSNTASNLKDISLSEEYNEPVIERKFISNLNLENRTRDEKIINVKIEANEKYPNEISNSYEEDNIISGLCFCKSKCEIHKDLNTNELENSEITDEFLNDLFSCPDCIHTCGINEEYNSSKSNASTFINLNAHSKKTKQCPYCDKKYESNYRLKIHLYSHSGERPFVCDICGHGFARRPNLMAHYRVHSGAKEYSCTKCDRTFGHPSDRIAHLINRVCDRAIHVKETEDGWQCITCGKAEFKSYNQAERHGRTHESAHVKKCPVCQEEFRGRKLHPLVKHVRICHPEYMRELGL
ncbi:unnamed protein product [Meganyctiphanes norvegica]|uniref:C2H2-type domain-containing protein n=1 Tax=Meganyctiphanes norvegica TaxID=48144 RepID=A0AAV2QJP8_MEGNR